MYKKQTVHTRNNNKKTKQKEDKHDILITAIKMSQAVQFSG